MLSLFTLGVEHVHLYIYLSSRIVYVHVHPSWRSSMTFVLFLLSKLAIALFP